MRYTSGSFRSGGRTWLVSAGGAAQIRWSRNGRELFYAQTGTLIATSVRTEPEFAMGPATRLFSHGAFNEWWDPNYDVSADGKRILSSRECESTGGEGDPCSPKLVRGV